MLEVKVDRDDQSELHLQVAGQIRRAIAAGEATAGQRLPPAKHLAAVAGVNKNTVLRALRLLRSEGLLEFQRGRGVRVVGSPGQGVMLQRVQDLVSYAREQGYQRDELIRLISDAG